MPLGSLWGSILKTFFKNCKPGTCFLRYVCPCAAQGCIKVQIEIVVRGQLVHLDLIRHCFFIVFAPMCDLEACFFTMCYQKGFKCFLAGLFQLPATANMRKYAQIIVGSFKTGFAKIPQRGDIASSWSSKCDDMDTFRSHFGKRF